MAMKIGYKQLKVPIPIIRGLGPTLIPRPVKLRHRIAPPLTPPPFELRSFDQDVERFHRVVVDTMNRLMADTAASSR